MATVIQDQNDDDYGVSFKFTEEELLLLALHLGTPTTITFSHAQRTNIREMNDLLISEKNRMCMLRMEREAEERARRG